MEWNAIQRKERKQEIKQKNGLNKNNIIIIIMMATCLRRGNGIYNSEKKKKTKQNSTRRREKEMCDKFPQYKMDVTRLFYIHVFIMFIILFSVENLRIL